MTGILTVTGNNLNNLYQNLLEAAEQIKQNEFDNVWGATDNGDYAWDTVDMTLNTNQINEFVLQSYGISG